MQSFDNIHKFLIKYRKVKQENKIHFQCIFKSEKLKPNTREEKKISNNRNNHLKSTYEEIVVGIACVPYLFFLFFLCHKE